MLNDNRDLFIHRLVTSAEEFIWAAQSLPAARFFVKPPDWLRVGDDSAQRLIDQLANFERNLTLPTLRYAAGGPEVSVAAEEQARWDVPRPERSLSELTEELRRLRASECAVITMYTPVQWTELCSTPWGAVSPRWVAHRTYHQTLALASTLNGILLAATV